MTIATDHLEQHVRAAIRAANPLIGEKDPIPLDQLLVLLNRHADLRGALGDVIDALTTRRPTLRSQPPVRTRLEYVPSQSLRGIMTAPRVKLAHRIESEICCLLLAKPWLLPEISELDRAALFSKEGHAADVLAEVWAFANDRQEFGASELRVHLAMKGLCSRIKLVEADAFSAANERIDMSDDALRARFRDALTALRDIRRIEASSAQVRAARGAWARDTSGAAREALDKAEKDFLSQLTADVSDVASHDTTKSKVAAIWLGYPSSFVPPSKTIQSPVAADAYAEIEQAFASHIAALRETFDLLVQKARGV